MEMIRTCGPVPRGFFGALEHAASALIVTKAVTMYFWLPLNIDGNLHGSRTSF